MSFDLRDAQQRQHEWSRKNFPDRRADHAVMGLIEEIGELCEAVEPEDDCPEEYLHVMDLMRFVGRLAHINLKRAQGIRKASTTFDRECDALDQLARALADYGNRVGYPPNSDAEYEPLPPRVVDVAEQDALGDIGVYLLDRCNRKGYDYAEILETTLAQVLKRDWRKSPSTGVA